MGCKIKCDTCNNIFENDEQNNRIQKNELNGQYYCFECALNEYMKEHETQN